MECANCKKEFIGEFKLGVQDDPTLRNRMMSVRLKNPETGEMYDIGIDICEHCGVVQRTTPPDPLKLPSDARQPGRKKE